MPTLPGEDCSIDLRAVTVSPTWGAQEHQRWDRLLEEHHYLRFHGIVGKGLRCVAVHGETWIALIGWQPGAFKLAARDRWVGWSAEQQSRHLHLIANNSRSIILTVIQGGCSAPMGNSNPWTFRDFERRVEGSSPSPSPHNPERAGLLHSVSRMPVSLRWHRLVLGVGIQRR